MSTKSEIPTRKQIASEKSAESNDTAGAVRAPMKSLAGRYRVREGYKVSHGDVDADGRHKISSAGSIIELSHDEALSVIRLTKDQKDADGRPNGPAIETEDAYNARIEAKRAHDEFLQSLSDANNMP